MSDFSIKKAAILRYIYNKYSLRNWRQLPIQNIQAALTGFFFNLQCVNLTNSKSNYLLSTTAPNF